MTNAEFHKEEIKNYKGKDICEDFVRPKILKKKELDIQLSAHKIAYAIKNTILENYSFYIYILPFEQAEKDSIKIMDDATSVGRQS